MKQYLELVRHILETGNRHENRTGIATLSVPGVMLRFDLQEGFPAITTRKLAFKSAMGELVGFLRGYDNATDFRDLGCNVWDANANENKEWLANPYRQGEDYLGPIYGVQWRGWQAYKTFHRGDRIRIRDAALRGYHKVIGNEQFMVMRKSVDQLQECLDTIVTNPTSRRILFHAWNPAELDQMALPPCHLLYQFLPDVAHKELSMCLYMRSNDLGLGAPFNIAEGAALLHLVGRLTGYAPRWLTYFIADAHIYETHAEMLEQQLQREPFDLPQLVLSEQIPDYAKTGVYEPKWLCKVAPSDFSLVGYQHHGALTAPMAV